MPVGVAQLRVSVVLAALVCAFGLLLQAIATLIAPHLTFPQADPGLATRNILVAALLISVSLFAARYGMRWPRLLGLPVVLGNIVVVTGFGILTDAANAGIQVFYLLGALLAGYHLPRPWAFGSIVPLLAGQQLLVWSVLDQVTALADTLYVPALLAMAVYLLVKVREMDARDEVERVREASLDPLTRLPTRQRMHEAMAAAAAMERPEPVSLVLIDVDHFKVVNDTFGHPFGDQALNMVADVLRHVACPHGLPVRLGGDEFAVLLPGETKEAAEILARQIVEHVGSQRLEFEDRPVSILVSVGVACARNAQQIPGLYRRADRALYRAKRSGCGSSASTGKAEDAWSTPAGEAIGRVGCGRGKDDCRRLQAIRRLRGQAGTVTDAV